MTSDKLKTAAGDAARNLAETGREILSETTTKVAEVAAGAGSALRQQAQGRAEAGKDAVAGEGERLAESLHKAAAQQEGTIQARLLDTVANSVGELADSLRSNSFNSMVSRAEDFARSNPGAFVATAAIVGFALVRFARSSSEDAARIDQLAETAALTALPS